MLVPNSDVIHVSHFLFSVVCLHLGYVLKWNPFMRGSLYNFLSLTLLVVEEVEPLSRTPLLMGLPAWRRVKQWSCNNSEEVKVTYAASLTLSLCDQLWRGQRRGCTLVAPWLCSSWLLWLCVLLFLLFLPGASVQLVLSYMLQWRQTLGNVQRLHGEWYLFFFLRIHKHFYLSWTNVHSVVRNYAHITHRYRRSLS